jgi:hypothetical protein
VWVDAWKQEKRFVVSLRGSVRDLKTATNVTAVSHIRLALIALVNLQFFLKKLHLLRPWQRNMRNLGGVQKKTCTVKTGENYKWLNFVGGGGLFKCCNGLSRGNSKAAPCSAILSQNSACLIERILIAPFTGLKTYIPIHIWIKKGPQQSARNGPKTGQSS